MAGRDYGSPCVRFVDFRLKVIHRVLGVVMVRFFAVFCRPAILVKLKDRYSCF